MDIDISTIESEIQKEREIRFQRQKELLERVNKKEKKYKWRKNNHVLFPERRKLPPVKNKKNDIDFD